MFCNGSRMDESDLGHPGPATIAGMTSLEVLFVPAHDCGRHRRLIGPISACELMDMIKVEEQDLHR